MPIQVIQPRAKQPGFLEKVMGGLTEGVVSEVEKASELRQQQQENEQIKKLTGLDFSGIRDPKMRQQAFAEAIKGENLAAKRATELRANEKIISDLEERRNLPKGSLSAYIEDPKMAETVSRPPKEGKIPTTEKPVPPEISKNIKKILADNPKASADELRIAMDEAKIPPVYSNPYTENRRREQEQISKKLEEEQKSLIQETLPIRTEIAQRGETARRGIETKQEGLKLIRTGNLNDPTVAAVLENLPFKLGQRMLSPETVQYKAGLVDNYSDLKNLFSGATRVKEIDILENKIADIYLTDEQKTRILESRINAHKADIIRAEVAAEMEEEGKFYGIGKYRDELEKRARPRLNALFNQIVDEQQAIVKDAENRKKIPLKFDDPDDMQIIEQIFLEAGKNPEKAEELARKKGYSW